MKSITSDWILDGLFWLDLDSGDPGDLIYNTISRDNDRNDRSVRAKAAYYVSKELLASDKRWPDDCTLAHTANNRIQWWGSKFLNKIGIKVKLYTRPQDDMTRDPYIAVITAAVRLGKAEEIDSIKIPWYCYNRSVWKWRKDLINDNRPHWKRRLSYYMATATMLYNYGDPNVIINQNDPIL